MDKTCKRSLQHQGCTSSNSTGEYFNTFACWVIFHAFFCRLLIFFKINFVKNFFQEYHPSKCAKRFELRSEVIS